MKPKLALMILTIAFPQVAWALQLEDAPSPGNIDVSDYQLNIEIIPERAFMRGEALVRFTPASDSLSIPFNLNGRLTVVRVSDAETDERLTSRYTDFASDRMLVRAELPFSAGREYTLRFEYEGSLETENYAFLNAAEDAPAFIGRDGAVLQTRGHWFPSHDLPIDTATVRVRAVVPLGFAAVAPGELEIETLGITEAFNWTSSRPLGDVPLVAARFLRQRFEDGPMPLTFFLREDFSKDLSPMADAIGKILTFYREEFGEPLTRELALVQVGNVVLSEAGSLGLILLDAKTLESHSVPVFALARKLALQWWGFSTRIEAVHDAWLRDGFANYAALRYLEEQATPDEYSTQLAFQAVDALKYQERAPVSDGLKLEPGSPQYDSIVAAKGAWVLYMLSQLVERDRFNPLLSDWFQRIRDQSASTSGFLDFVNSNTGKDYGWFFAQWIETVGVPEFKTDYTIFKRRDGTFRIQGQLRQNLDLFRMPVDILVETKGTPETKTIDVQGRRTSFNFIVETLPLRLKFDPGGKILLDSEGMQLRVHLSVGDEFLEQGEFVAAIAEYEKAKRLDPRSSLVHYRLGETYFKQSGFNLAANSFRDCLNGDLKPDWVEVWSHIHLGKIFDILGQRQRALAEYQKAINSQNDHEGAQQEAKKYLDKPFSRPSNVIGG